MDLPFSEACERNKGPILKILQNELKDTRLVLEIGSGTGQHAVYFAEHMPHLNWQPSELFENLTALASRIKKEGPQNIKPPVELDAERGPWNFEQIEALFVANVFHISPIEVMEACIEGASKVLNSSGKLCIYGPFRYHGSFTSPSNAQFDASLKQNHSLWGIRDFEYLKQSVEEKGFRIQEDHIMPANNQLIVCQKF